MLSAKQIPVLAIINIVIVIVIVIIEHNFKRIFKFENVLDRVHLLVIDYLYSPFVSNFYD